jgi:hypothetical protein
VVNVCEGRVVLCQVRGRIEGVGEDHQRDWMIRGINSRGRENNGL